MYVAVEEQNPLCHKLNSIIFSIQCQCNNHNVLDLIVRLCIKTKWWTTTFLYMSVMKGKIIWILAVTNVLCWNRKSVISILYCMGIGMFEWKPVSVSKCLRLASWLVSLAHVTLPEELFSYSVATRGYLTHLSFNSNIPWLIATELLLQFQTTKHLWFKIMWLYEVTDNKTFCGLKLCDDLVWWQYDSLKFLLIFDVNE